MENWLNFWLLIIAQFSALIAVAYFRRQSSVQAQDDGSYFSTAAASIVGGLAFGIMFDGLLGGRLQFFSYYLASGLFLFANAVFSYGLAVATALRLSPSPLSSQAVAYQRALALFALFSTACIFVHLAVRGPVTSLWAAGALIVLVGELLELFVLKSVGPFVEGLTGRYTRPAQSWLAVAALGGFYELANWFFPVWRWTFSGQDLSPAYHLMIIVFGYPVLFHAARIIGLLSLRLTSKLGHAAFNRRA